ncbi:Pentatricopeptide repeat-containing protein, mitochondrial [Mycena sanguinolenta]|uniref:Pentatricopeptide repeat-containing protein, mitochondrial n=1 Tax=Mycena sanguinolenta TaxID=230812 RepID=A0A8H6XFF2_9AGAR|nr:Pentatricopeptide repeat-containing protein, mitochondrial [Mycena sanguinolenta]
MLASSSRLAVCIPSTPARIVRAASASSKKKSFRSTKAPSFPPKQKPKPSTPDQNGVIDPVLFLQLRQRIIERHNPSSLEMDEPLIQLVNKIIYNIKIGLEKQNFDAIRESWEELRRANHLHVLTPKVLEQIAQLATSILPTRESLRPWDSNRSRGDSKAVLELYEKYRLLPKTRDAPSEGLDPELLEPGVDIVPSKMHSGRVNLLLAAVTAHALDDSFQDALKLFLDTEIQIPAYCTEEFLRTLSHDPDLQTKVELYVRRLDIAKSVARPNSTSKHIYNLSKRSAPVLLPCPNLFGALSSPPFLRREQNDLAAKVWKDMAKFGMRPGILTWNMVIHVYADRGALEEVLAAWRTISAHNIKPDATTYRALISCLFGAKRIDEALHWFRTFEANVKPNCTIEQSLLVYNATLHNLLQLGRETAEIAFSILQKMQDDGPKPDLVSYNTMLGYHGRQGDFKAMAALITQMGSAHVVGDVFTYSTILSALLKVGRADAPEMVINIMRNQGVEASVVTYSAIIQSQMEEQSILHLKSTMRLLDEMEKDPRVAPNEITYTSILAGLYRGSWLTDEQLAWYKRDIRARMKKNNVSFKASGYNILIKACLKEPRGLEDALEFYREMALNKVPRNDDTWYIMFSGLLNREEWEVARAIVDEMLASGAQPAHRVLRLATKIRNGQG